MVGLIEAPGFQMVEFLGLPRIWYGWTLRDSPVLEWLDFQRLSGFRMVGFLESS